MAVRPQGHHELTALFPIAHLPALTALTERYEDHPDERPAVAEGITAVLTRFLEVAPWPLDRAG